jgi:predicted Fe-Mo cluster-binding NifX family protein
VVAIDATGVSSRREAEGCCGSLAKAVADCEAVVCTAIGRGAAAHLAEAGVRLVVVPEGTTVEAAIAGYRTGGLPNQGAPTACTHGHQEARRDCGCGRH